MKEKIYKYLLSCPEGVPTQELLEEFFKIYSDGTQGMEKILQNLLKGDNRFKVDENGRWFASDQELKEEDISQILFAVIDFLEVALSRRLKLPILMGMIFMKNNKIERKELLKINPEKIFGFHLNLISGLKQNLAEVPNDFEGHAREIFIELQESILVSRMPRRHRNLLNSLSLRTIGIESEYDFLSLKDLSRQIKGKQFKELTEQRLSVEFESRFHAFHEKLKVQSDILADILLDCWEQNIRTMIELKDALSQKEIWVDFKNYNFNREFLMKLPEKPGVYFFIDEKDKIFYVGKSRNLRARVRSYFVNRFQPSEKNKKILARVKNIEYELAGSELEALLLENHYIRKYKPELNVQVDVHRKRSGQKIRKRIVIFLPGTSQFEVRLLYLDGTKRAMIFPVNIIIEDDIALAQDKFHNFFNGLYLPDEEFDKQQIYLIWRWYDLNKEHLTILDVDDYSGLLQCAMMIPKIIYDKSIFRQPIIFREPLS